MKLELSAFSLKQLKELNLQRLIYTRRYLVLSLAVLFTSGGIILLAILPQVKWSLDLRDQVGLENTALQALQKKVRGLAQVSDLEGYGSRDKVEAVLPLEKPLLPLLTTAGIISQETGAQIVDIETNPGFIASGSAATSARTAQAAQTVNKVHGVDTLDIRVELAGTLDQINSFISRIETAAPITNVSEIELERNTPDAKRNVQTGDLFSAKLTLTTYYFTQAIKVAVDEPLPEIGVTERNFLNQLETYTFPAMDKVNQVQGGGQEDLFGTSLETSP